MGGIYNPPVGGGGQPSDPFTLGTAPDTATFSGTSIDVTDGTHTSTLDPAGLLVGDGADVSTLNGAGLSGTGSGFTYSMGLNDFNMNNAPFTWGITGSDMNIARTGDPRYMLLQHSGFTLFDSGGRANTLASDFIVIEAAGGVRAEYRAQTAFLSLGGHKTEIAIGEIRFTGGANNLTIKETVSAAPAGAPAASGSIDVVVNGVAFKVPYYP